MTADVTLDVVQGYYLALSVRGFEAEADLLKRLFREREEARAKVAAAVLAERAACAALIEAGRTVHTPGYGGGTNTGLRWWNDDAAAAILARPAPDGADALANIVNDAIAQECHPEFGAIWQPGGMAYEACAQAKREGIEAHRNTIEVADIWLTAALECPDFRWDGDQHEAATQTRDELRALLPPINKGA